MAFSLSGTTITQTGTDTDLSGLSGTAGVTKNGLQYTLDGVRLEINGNLTMNGFVERLRFINSPTSGINNSDAQIAVRSGATFTVEASRLINGDTVNKVLPVIDFGNFSIEFGVQSFINLRRHMESDVGSTVNLSGVLTGNTASNGLAYAFDGTTNLTDVYFINQGSNQSLNQQVAFARGGDITINNANLIGYTYTDRGGNYLFINGLSVAEDSDGFVWDNTVTTSPLYLEVYSYNANQISSNEWITNVTPSAGAGSVVNLINSYQGNDTAYFTNQDVSRNMRAIITNRLNVTPVDSSFSSVSAKVYAVDVDNGNRGMDFTPQGQSPVLASGDIEYLQTGQNITFNVISGIFNPDMSLDARGVSGSADLAFSSIEYLYNIATFQPTLTGLGDKSVSPIMLDDSSIAESTKATVDAYTEIETSAKFYDRAKAYLVDNYAGETSTILTRSGDTIDAGSYNVTIDTTAGSVFSFDGTTITILANTFTGNINTTGTLTLSNGAVHNGLLNGEYFTFDSDVITENYPKVVATSNATITVDAINFTGEFIVRNGAQLTVNGDNNAKTLNSTQTETYGTIIISDDLVPSSNYIINTTNKTITLSSGTTETDLSGLRGMLEVDYFNIGGISQYSTDYRLVISGTLSHEPENEVITFGANIPHQSVLVTATGVYNYGRVTTLFGYTSRSTGVGMLITQEGHSNYGDPVFDVQNGGTLNWNGGIIHSAGTFYFRSGSNVTIRDGEIEIENPTSGHLVRSFTTLLDIDGFIKRGGGFILYENPANFSGYQPIYSDLSPQAIGRDDYALLLYGGTSDVIEIRDFSGFGNPNEIGYIDLSKGKFINPINGSDTTFSGWLTTNNRSAFYGEITKELEFNFTDENGSGTDAKIFIQDIDSGNRLNQNGQDNTADKIYSVETSGATTNFEVINGIVNVLNGVNYNLVDVRFPNNTTSVKFISYSRQLAQTEVSLLGNGVQRTDWVLFPDSAITEANETTVLAYTTQENAAKTYDHLKALLVRDYAGETQTVVSKIGNTIDFGNRDVVIDGTGNGEAIITPTQVTIYASLFDGDITTTGTITKINGAVLTSENGVVQVVTLNFIGIESGSAILISDASKNTLEYVTNNTSTSYSYITDSGYTGNLYYTIFKEDYSEYKGVLNIDGTQATINLSVSQAQIFDTDGAPMYAGGLTSANLTFRIASGEIVGDFQSDITAKVFYDEFQLFLRTEDAMKWLIDNTNIQRLSVSAGKQQILIETNVKVNNDTGAGTYYLEAEVVTQDTPFDISTMGAVASAATSGVTAEDIYLYFTNATESRPEPFKADLTTVLANQNIINEGVKDASLIIPHNTDLI